MCLCFFFILSVCLPSGFTCAPLSFSVSSSQVEICAVHFYSTITVMVNDISYWARAVAIVRILYTSMQRFLTRLKWIFSFSTFRWYYHPTLLFQLVLLRWLRISRTIVRVISSRIHTNNGIEESTHFHTNTDTHWFYDKINKFLLTTDYSGD